MHYDVIFVYPPVMQKFHATDPPFGLMSLGAVLRDAGHSVKILDLNRLRPDFETVEQLFKDNTASVIGIGGMTTVYYYIKKLVAMLERTQPEAKRIGGGSFVTPCPEIILRNNSFNAVCIGEGDAVIVPLVRRLMAGQSLEGLSNIAWLDGDEFKQGSTALIPNIDVLPFPAYELVDMPYYLKATGKRPALIKATAAKGVDINTISNYFVMFSRRGCPFNCTFCYRNFGNQVRVHSVDYIIRHVLYVQETFGVNSIAFYDETFNNDREWVLEFCRRARTELPNIWFWIGGARADLLDEQMVERLYDAKFYEVSIGVESFDDRILKEMGKRLKSKKLKDTIRLLERFSLAPSYLGLLYGFPGDDEKSLEQTVSTCLLLGIPGYFQFPLPFPGTIIYKQLRRANKIGDEEAYMLSLQDQMTQDLFMNLSRYDDATLQNMVRVAD